MHVVVISYPIKLFEFLAMHTYVSRCSHMYACSHVHDIYIKYTYPLYVVQGEFGFVHAVVGLLVQRSRSGKYEFPLLTVFLVKLVSHLLFHLPVVNVFSTCCQLPVCFHCHSLAILVATVLFSCFHRFYIHSAPFPFKVEPNSFLVVFW